MRGALPTLHHSRTTRRKSQSELICPAGADRSRERDGLLDDPGRIPTLAPTRRHQEEAPDDDHGERDVDPIQDPNVDVLHEQDVVQERPDELAVVTLFVRGLAELVLPDRQETELAERDLDHDAEDEHEVRDAEPEVAHRSSPGSPRSRWRPGRGG